MHQNQSLQSDLKVCSIFHTAKSIATFYLTYSLVTILPIILTKKIFKVLISNKYLEHSPRPGAESPRCRGYARRSKEHQ